MREARNSANDRKPQTGKKSGWSTALYLFAENVRALTGGRFNYKMLYDCIGTDGKLINHANPLVRKRTAATLSRLMHSLRYVDDLQDSFAENPARMDEAASRIAQALREAGWDDGALIEHFSVETWREVERGLGSEASAGRRDTNLTRIRREMPLLFAHCRILHGRGVGGALETLLSSYLHLLAFGRVNEGLVNTLVEETPLLDPASFADEEAGAEEGRYAFLVRFSGEGRRRIAGWWPVDPARPFTIGRYTDCDAIETDPFVSRLHCRVLLADGAWAVEDAGSTHGTRVFDSDDRLLFDSARSDERRCEIRFGSFIELAGRVRYWFGSLRDDGLPGAGALPMLSAAAEGLGMMGIAAVPHSPSDVEPGGGDPEDTGVCPTIIDPCAPTERGPSDAVAERAEKE